MAGIIQSWVQPLGEVSLTQKQVLGEIRYEGKGRWYKYLQLQNSATVAGAVGDQVLYFAATGYLNNRVVTRAADGDAVPFAAGVLAAVAAGVAATAYYIWVQIKGQVTLSTAVTSAAAGKAFTGSTTNATFTVRANAYDPVAGISMNTTTGVCLDCPF